MPSKQNYNLNKSNISFSLKADGIAAQLSLIKARSAEISAQLDSVTNRNLSDSREILRQRSTESLDNLTEESGDGLQQHEEMNQGMTLYFFPGLFCTFFSHFYSYIMVFWGFGVRVLNWDFLVVVFSLQGFWACGVSLSEVFGVGALT